MPVTSATSEIWVRTDTGPVLMPGEHAPWRAAPVAPPQPAGESEGRSLFFAAPVPAQRGDQRVPTGENPIVAAPVAEEAVPEPEETRPFARPHRGPLRLAVENTGDQDAIAAFAGRHRGELPDHLDFVRNLGLAQRRDDDEVGPSS